jgi:hypothetical protein
VLIVKTAPHLDLMLEDGGVLDRIELLDGHGVRVLPNAAVDLGEERTAGVSGGSIMALTKCMRRG